MSDGSRSMVSLSFVAAVDDLVVELDDFQEYASEPDDETIVYKVPQSPASEMLLKLKIMELEGRDGAPNDWRLIEFRRYKRPPPSTGGLLGGFGFGAVGDFASSDDDDDDE
ncbi:hypothetical protein AAVH_20763 [Aphelenchoides avenae]|nr:hypothetical protein AAVH_20763 [Aphelenchus avenae]